MGYPYEITHEDGSSYWLALHLTQATRQHLTKKALDDANPGEKFEIGVVWDIPFNHDPDDGMGYDPVPLEMLNKGIAALARSKPECAPHWEPNRYTARALWMHWGNRAFRAWQLKRGGNIDHIQSGPLDVDGDGNPVKAPDFQLPYPKPAPALPAAPKDPTTPSTCDTNSGSCPLKTEQDLKKYADAIFEASYAMYAVVQRFAQVAQEVAELVAAAEVAKGLTLHLAVEYRFGPSHAKEMIGTLAGAASGLLDDLDKKLKADYLAGIASKLSNKVTDAGKVLKHLVLGPDADGGAIAAYWAEPCLSAEAKEKVLYQLSIIQGCAAELIAAGDPAHWKELEGAIDAALL